MGWRSLYLSNKSHLDLKTENGQLSIAKEGEKPLHLRIEDINFILIDSYDFFISGKTLELLAKHHIPLVLTSSVDHMPVLQLANPYSAHHQMGRIITKQSKMTQKIKFEIWKKIISYKIISQGYLIEEVNQGDIMSKKAINAKSNGSLLGIEGSWAKYYWSRLTDGKDFVRIPKVYGEPNDTMNSFLNYTYAILRARIASAIAENGMLPLFSLFHRRDYNPFALADDIIEPYRWTADYIFREHIETISNLGEFQILTPEIKKIALSVLHLKVFIVSLNRAFSLDEAIRIGVRGFRETIMTGDIDKMKDLLCKLPR